MATALPDVILGDTLMKNFYTYFDMENKQVGFQAIPGGMPVGPDPRRRVAPAAAAAATASAKSPFPCTMTVTAQRLNLQNTIGASCAPFGPPGTGLSGKFQGSCEAGTLTLYQSSDCTGQGSSQADLRSVSASASPCRVATTTARVVGPAL